MRGRGYTPAEVKALDDACALASAVSPPGEPLDRRPIFDAARTLLGRGFSRAEAEALDRACGDAAGGKAPARPRLGSLSEIFESGKRGPGTVSSGSNDPGGASYGIYQLSSKAGTLRAFLRSEGRKWAAELAGSAPGGSAFARKWRAIAAREPEPFRDAQHAFIERTHYRAAVDQVKRRKGIDLDRRRDAVREAVWSVAVQHAKSATILGDAVDAADGRAGRGDPDYDRRLIEAIYRVRTAYVLKVAAGRKQAAERGQLVGVARKRYPAELAACLRMLDEG